MGDLLKGAPQLARPRKLAQQLMTSLSERIQDGKLRPGDKLPTESEIVSAYGVSRTVVREALSRLQASGLVETRHGIGTFVIEATPADPLRIAPEDVATVKEVMTVLELRVAIESEAAALAAARRTKAQLSEMRCTLDAFGASLAAGGDTVKSDFRFHMQIAEATGNRHFAKFMAHLGLMVIPRTRVESTRLAREDSRAYLDRVNREHTDVLEAIARRDPEGARAAMRTHLANSRARLQRALEAVAPGRRRVSQ
jgi:GntR family transcriptional repressor for pyruvate dehydrogenase complex